MHSTPGLRLVRFYSHGRLPARADRFSGGTIPLRAARFCDAVTLASGFGWWLFPPVDTILWWDGRNISWSNGGEQLTPIDDAVHFPGFPYEFEAVAPERLKGAAHPYLTALPEPGIVQVSLGVLASTAPGWCSLIRRPANFPLPGHFEHFEGIVGTDNQLQHLFINIRLTRTDFPIRLHSDMPLVQLQPLRRDLLYEEVMLDFSIGSLGPAEWESYYETVAKPNARKNRPLGAYAANERRLRRGVGNAVRDH